MSFELDLQTVITLVLGVVFLVRLEGTVRVLKATLEQVQKVVGVATEKLEEHGERLTRVETNQESISRTRGK